MIKNQDQGKHYWIITPTSDKPNKNRDQVPNTNMIGGSSRLNQECHWIHEIK